MKMAMKLKKAAKTTACPGRRTPVDTTVAIEFAASWKPFMKSNTSASATRKMMTQRATCMVAMIRPLGSGVLEDHALDEFGHVVTPVGDGFQQLIDGLELDQLTHIGLFAEQLAQCRVQHRVGLAFQLVDLGADLQRGGSRLKIGRA